LGHFSLIHSFEDSDIFLDSVFLSAVKNSNHEKVRNILEESLSNSEKKIEIDFLDAQKMNALSYSLKNDDFKMYEILTEYGANVNKTVLNGQTILIYYISTEKTQLLKKIIESGCNLNAQDKLGRSSIMVAIESLNDHAVKVLSEHEYDINLTDYSGNTIYEYLDKIRNVRKKILYKNLLDIH
tara:strand:- start:5112 stop:5660 length:549 start_codon:yes stop_codon:yes gene_type:complete